MKETLELSRKLGSRLRKIRKDRGLGLLDVAVEAERLTTSDISKLENGRRTFSLSTLTRLADVLGHDVEIILKPRD